MIKREIISSINKVVSKIPVIVVTGPRQSGKTTLVKSLFSDYHYVNLEFPDVREQARSDPRNLLLSHPEGIIIDEIQHVPELVSYIQGFADESKSNGKYILTGSQNFLLAQSISQSLAGRVIIFNLLPFSLGELKASVYKRQTYEEYMVSGFYPRVYDQELEPDQFYPSYIQTYVERDVRQIINIRYIDKFQLFLRLCAGRTGQLLNHTSLSNETGMDAKTIKTWLSILELSHIIFLLRPYHQNFNKRLVKTPKLYFYDTGLVCSLLGIKNPDQLFTHYLKGELFESFILSEIMKTWFNSGQRPSLHFWRDNSGNEIDCLIETGSHVIPIEIKSGRTLHSDFFKGLELWSRLSGRKTGSSVLIYGGEENQTRSQGNVLSWNSLDKIMNLPY